MSFVTGDVVRIKGQNVNLTVGEYLDELGKYCFVWFDEEKQLRRDSVFEEMLEYAEPCNS